MELTAFILEKNCVHIAHSKNYIYPFKYYLTSLIIANEIHL